MAVRHLVSLADLEPAEIEPLVRRAASIERELPRQSLAGRLVGLLFLKTSTRTRTSFTAAALKLGANVIAYGPGDLQTNTGETLADTATVLSGYLDGLVVRSAGPIEDMRTLASQPSMAVVNAMSACEHPTQAVADLATILQQFGCLNGVHMLYVGEGNNTAAALALAISRLPGMRLSLRTPRGYGLPDATVAQLAEACRNSSSVVEEGHEIDDLPKDVDVVYTTRWQTTGTSKPDPLWRAHFEPFRVTDALMERVSRRDTVFMHDLPAVRGDEVTAGVLEGPRSLAFRQAQNKLYAAMATLEWCLGRRAAG